MVLFWVFSLLAFTVLTSVSLSKRMQVQILVEEEERPSNSNLLEEFQWKAVSHSSGHNSDELNNKDGDKKLTPVSGDHLLYDLCTSKVNEIPPEHLG